jgi:hypothetical protein
LNLLGKVEHSPDDRNEHRASPAATEIQQFVQKLNLVDEIELRPQ